MRLNNLTELTYFQDYIIESMKYEAIYQLHFWNDTTIPYEDDDASGILAYPYFGRIS